VVKGGQRRSRESWKTTIGSQGALVGKLAVTALKRFSLLFLREKRRREMKLLLMKMMMMR
jgi:hypothetical protein